MPPERNPWRSTSTGGNREWEWRFGAYQTRGGDWRNPEAGQRPPKPSDLTSPNIFRFAVKDPETGFVVYRSTRGPVDPAAIDWLVAGLMLNSP